MLLARVGSTVDAILPLELRAGFHVNSNTPSDPYLIPMRLTWDSSSPLASSEVTYPKPTLEKFAFSEMPVSVFAGRFNLITRFKVSPSARPGPTTLSGQVRYQACNERMCLQPMTLTVALPVTIVAQ